MAFWGINGTFNHYYRRYKKDLGLFEAIKAEPELAPVSKKLGVKSLILSIISMLIMGAGVGVIYWLTTIFSEHVFVAIIGIILAIAVMLTILIEVYIRAFRFLRWQFKLNKKPIAWIALVAIIVPSIVVIGGVALVAISYFAG